LLKFLLSKATILALNVLLATELAVQMHWLFVGRQNCAEGSEAATLIRRLSDREALAGNAV